MSKASDPVTPDRLKEIRERAEKCFIENWTLITGVILDPEQCEAAVKFAAAFAQSEREAAERETQLECAKAMCTECKEDFYWSPAQKNGDTWIHSCLNLPGKSECKAAAIHELARGKGEL